MAGLTVTVPGGCVVGEGWPGELDPGLVGEGDGEPEPGGVLPGVLPGVVAGLDPASGVAAGVVGRPELGSATRLDSGVPEAPGGWVPLAGGAGVGPGAPGVPGVPDAPGSAAAGPLVPAAELCAGPPVSVAVPTAIAAAVATAAAT
jgi:hypothetical protein